MKCDKCDKPAVVHEVVIRGGEKRELHLCADHAMKEGIAMPQQQPIDQLLTKFVTSKSDSKHPSEQLSCDGCGLPFKEFRKRGILGCPDCYEIFVDQLEPLIMRAQNGACHHTGSIPSQAGASIDRQLSIRRLADELDSAVAAEQYERAAELRDQLDHMKLHGPDKED
ncbi:MAG: UvrB/UvrC motif-containing protein [Phycisphaerales bacterium]|nr:UvrB/UvrC motif-containing protein [Phycisphaerales bacterium]